MFPQLQPHERIFRKLTPADFSSEEDSPALTRRNGRPTYVVRRKPCYDYRLTRLKQQIERIYFMRVRPALGRSGREPHLREYSSDYSPSKRVAKGLPANCYSTAWWQDLPDAERRTMHVDLDAHDFTVPEELLDPEVVIPPVLFS